MPETKHELKSLSSLPYTPCECSHCREYRERLAGKAFIGSAGMKLQSMLNGIAPLKWNDVLHSISVLLPSELQRNERKLSFLLSLTPIQRKHLYSHLIAFKTFASRKFGRATRCTIVILQGSFPMIGFRAYRNGVPTEVPGTNCAYNTFKQCYPLHQDVLDRERILWEC